LIGYLRSKKDRLEHNRIGMPGRWWSTGGW
jgi:hypothetical protein